MYKQTCLHNVTKYFGARAYPLTTVEKSHDNITTIKITDHNSLTCPRVFCRVYKMKTLLISRINFNFQCRSQMIT